MRKLIAVYVGLIGVIIASGILHWPLVQAVACGAFALLVVWTIVAALIAAIDYM